MDLTSGAAGRPWVLVVDDDPTIAEVVGRYLHRAGYDVRVAHDGHQALQALSERPVLIVILDVMLPRLSGLEVLRRLRTAPGPQPAVILVTARGDESDRVDGLLAGADDYVVKPFSPRELVARVDAVLRRTHRPLQQRTASDELAPLTFGDLHLDVAGRRATLNGTQIKLTQMEFDLLLHLARTPGIALSRVQLMRAVWGYESYTDTSTVTVHIKRLRDKIQPEHTSHQYLRTVRGIGYSFEPPT